MKTIRATHHFHGGIHPVYNKQLAMNEPITALPIPASIRIPMSQHLGAPAKPLVSVGEHVDKGQRIGEKTGFISVNIHASVSGTVSALENGLGASGRACTHVVITPDAEQPPCKTLPQITDWRAATPEVLLARIDDAGICGMGGAGFPTTVKLTPPKGKVADTIILNGAECEPYLTADYRVMLEHASAIRTGAEIMRHILGNPRIRIAIEDNKPEAIVAIEKAFADCEGDVAIVVLPTLYPQGSEKHQIYATTGRIVPEGKLPIDTGCVVENIGTALAIRNAVIDGLPLIERVTTVTGDAIATPRNVLAPCGTRYADMIAFCGGTRGTVEKIISGGPMMGFSVATTDIATTKTTSGLLALTAKTLNLYSSQACISCGRCVSVCPMNLEPTEISAAVDCDDMIGAENHHVMNCIECGACTYVCPAHRALTAHCRRAKAAIIAARAATPTADKGQRR